MLARLLVGMVLALLLAAAERPNTEADLRASWVTDSDLNALGRRTDLSRIDLSYTRVTDVGFQQLKNLPNVTDGFTGQAPDLGALEFGQTPPHYGPRP